MRSDRKGKQDDEVGVELKYCEHCGGLYVRERGAGVYCNNCQPKVADLPTPAPKRGRLVLPVRPHTAVDFECEIDVEVDFECEIDVEDVNDFEAAGGVA